MKLTIFKKRTGQVNGRKTVTAFANHYLDRFPEFNRHELADAIANENGKPCLTVTQVTLHLINLCKDGEVMAIPMGGGVYRKATDEQWQDWKLSQGWM